MTDQKYAAIYADPPWYIRNFSAKEPAALPSLITT